jgi:hypothetical protein
MIRKFIYLITLVSLFACEQVFNIEMPPHQSRLVVSSINGVDSLFYFTITKSRGITEPIKPYELINNATIKIFNGDNLLEVIEGATSTSEYGNIYLSSLARPIIKNKYRIDVSAPGYDQIVATDEAPSLVRIKKVDLDLKNKIKKDHNTYYQLSITFSDPPDEKNFYMAYAYFRISYSYREEDEVREMDSYIGLESDDPLIKNENNIDSWYRSDLLFTDASFDGKQDVKLNLLFNSYSMRYWSNWYTIHSAEFYVILRSSSEALYKFTRSQSLQRDAKDNPFAEPVKVFNNIPNGYGIFGFYANDIIKVEVPIEDLKDN